MNMNKQIGYITGGSLCDGLQMRIKTDESLEQIKTGKFVCIVGTTYKFFSLITDLRLEFTNQEIVQYPFTAQETILESVLKEHNIYTSAVLRPMLMLGPDNKPVPVKTIPAHFSVVLPASQSDVALIFGDEQDKSNRYFSIGKPLDMDTPVCLDLDRLTERSNGIFGKTGTGKTFLTRLILAGLIHRQKAVNIIFDMHSEYGLQARKEGPGNAFVKGLKTLFSDRVAIFSLDPESTRRRAGTPDVAVSLSYQVISPDDILSLQDELNLHATAVEASYLIESKYKKNWLAVLLSKGEVLKEFAQELGAHPESIAALYRKLKRIERLPFFSDLPEQAIGQSSVIDQMMEYIDKGINIVIEFGNYSSTFVYLIVANIITRRIHHEYIRKTEQFLGDSNRFSEPFKLLITIEEAHKFLNPQAARQTIFGTIAREMRKYYVSLLIVDQRPSCIDQEILSQIGTKVIAQLNDERDIQAVLTGSNNASALRSVLASLDSKKQALLLGHAVTMPVVVETREYNETFYQAMAPTVTTKQINEFIAELF